MNAMNGEGELLVLVELFKRYAALGPSQKVQFDLLLAGEEMNGKTPSAITLNEFSGIMSDALPYLSNTDYAGATLDQLEFLRSGYLAPLERKDYY